MNRLQNLIAVCRFETPPKQRGTHPSEAGFRLVEFVALDDGSRVFIRDDRGFQGRGFGLLSKGFGTGIRDEERTTISELEISSRNALLPDEPTKPGEAPDLLRYWEPAMTALAEADINVNIDMLNSLPVDIEFDPAVREWIETS